MDFDMSGLLGEELIQESKRVSEIEKQDSSLALMKMSSRTKAWKLCHDYLQGSWKLVTHKEIELRQISGGLTNLIYHVSLPDDVKPRTRDEPREVLLRLYGQKYNENETSTSDKVLENVIFTLLSERGLGPHLYGVFPEGRLEEFIKARSMTQEEVRDPLYSTVIAKKMAKVHNLNVPINKQNRWLFDTLDKYVCQIPSVRLDDVTDKNFHMAEKLLSFDFIAEVEWLKKFLSRVHSPIVFCHNDVQGGNILLKRDDEGNAAEDKKSKRRDRATSSTKCDEDRVMLIDFEFADYNFRGFDLANHLVEYMYDYTNDDFPFYNKFKQNSPSKERQLNFFSAYLGLQQSDGAAAPSETGGTSGEQVTPASLALPEHFRVRANSTGSMANKTPSRRTRHLSCQQQTEILFHEVQAFMLAPHLLWGMWGIIQSTNTKIPFGYWEYATDRMEEYLKHKNLILSKKKELVFGSGSKRTIQH